MPLTRSEQSRVNGAKSRGSVTPEGKARSAINRTTHGMYSTRVVLETESKEVFQILAGLYHGLLQPQDQLEIDLVDSLVHARWKIRRLEASHSAEINLTIAENRKDFTAKYGENIGPDILQALAYRISGKNLEILDKHLDRQERLFTRSLRNLEKYRKNQPLPSIEDLHDLEQQIPSNSQKEGFEPEPPPAPEPQPAPQTQNQRFEPSAPNPFQKIAIILVLLLSSLAFSLSWNATPPQERTNFPYASL